MATNDARPPIPRLIAAPALDRTSSPSAINGLEPHPLFAGAFVSHLLCA